MKSITKNFVEFSSNVELHALLLFTSHSHVSTLDIIFYFSANVCERKSSKTQLNWKILSLQVITHSFERATATDKGICELI